MLKIYETPTLEVVEIEVEKGFAVSDLKEMGTEQMGWQEGAWD